MENAKIMPQSIKYLLEYSISSYSPTRAYSLPRIPKYRNLQPRLATASAVIGGVEVAVPGIVKGSGSVIFVR